MPSKAHDISFIPVEPDHYPLLHFWLKQPHLQEWWGDADEELASIKTMVEGDDTTRPFLILLDGQPVGYIQYWFACDQKDDATLSEYPFLKHVPDDAVGIDLSIGDPQNLSRGIGSAAVMAMVEMLRSLGHTTIVIDPDPANHRAVRAYEKAGFRAIPSLIGRTGEDVLLMQHHLGD